MAGKRKQIIDRILWNRRPESPRDCGDIDEIVLHGVTVHVEQMNDRCWWIGIYKEGDFEGTYAPYWMGNFTATSRGVMTFSEQENAGIDWDQDKEHV